MNDEHSELVKEHFEMKYYDYDNLIRKLIPNYEEMHAAVIDCMDLPQTGNLSFLDLGIGSGETALGLLTKYPEAAIDGYDISPKMIALGKERLKNKSTQVEFTEKDINEIKLGQSIYDGCIAVLSVHHCNGMGKKQLFKKVYTSLKEGGKIVLGDIVNFDTDKETQQKEDEWKDHLYKQLGEKEGQYWFDNYLEEDLPNSVNEQLEWMKEAGFTSVGVTWKYMNYAVFFGKK